MKSSKKQIILLLVPQFIVTLFLVTGVLNGLLQSFGVMPSVGLLQPTTAYYQEVISNPMTLKSLFFSLWLAFASTLLSGVIGLGICYLFINQDQLPRWVQRMIRIPIIVPHIVTALFVILLFTPTGWFARLFYALGFENIQNFFRLWVFDPYGNGIILGYLWKEIPFVIFFTLILMRQIDKSLGEAAQTLGASRFQSFLYVTLPLCKKTIISALFIIFMFTFSAYEMPALLGPTLPKALPELAFIEYTHPDFANRPYAMALNGLILIVSLILSFIFFYWSEYSSKKEKSHEEV